MKDKMKKLLMSLFDLFGDKRNKDENEDAAAVDFTGVPFCSVCKTPFHFQDASTHFCPWCGGKLVLSYPQFCYYCGKELNTGNPNSIIMRYEYPNDDSWYILCGNCGCQRNVYENHGKTAPSLLCSAQKIL